MKRINPQLRPVTVHDEMLAQRCAQGRVVLIDDDSEILQALSALIDMAGYACETYTSGLAYLKVLAYNKPCFPGPCCVVCDVKMPDMDGLELQRHLVQSHETPLLIMSGASGMDEAIIAFRGGVLDFLTKPIDADTLLLAVDKALKLSTERQQQCHHQTQLATRIASLSQRERDIASLVAQGHTNPVIAQKLGIALRTVKLHRQRAMEKLGANNLADLIRTSDAGGL